MWWGWPCVRAGVATCYVLTAVCHMMRLYGSTPGNLRPPGPGVVLMMRLWEDVRQALGSRTDRIPEESIPRGPLLVPRLSAVCHMRSDRRNQKPPCVFPVIGNAVREDLSGALL